MLPSLKGGNLGDFQPGAASSVGQDGVFCNIPGLNMFWSSGPETSGYLDLRVVFFFSQAGKATQQFPTPLSCHKNSSHSLE